MKTDGAHCASSVSSNTNLVMKMFYEPPSLGDDECPDFAVEDVVLEDQELGRNSRAILAALHDDRIVGLEDVAARIECRPAQAIVFDDAELESRLHGTTAYAVDHGHEGSAPLQDLDHLPNSDSHR